MRLFWWTTKLSYKAVFAKGVRPAVMVGIVLAAFQQLCGINVVFNYTSTIFESVGANLDRQLFETVAIGFVNLVFTLVAMWQVDKLGRRPLMLIGSFGLSVLYIVLAVLLQNHACCWHRFCFCITGNCDVRYLSCPGYLGAYL